MARSTPRTGARFLAGNRGSRGSSSNRSTSQVPPGRHEKAALAKPLHPEHTAEKAGTILVLRRTDIGLITPATPGSGTYHLHDGVHCPTAAATVPATPPDNGTWRGGTGTTYKGKAESIRK